MNRISLEYLAIGAALVVMVVIAASWLPTSEQPGCSNPRRGGVEAIFLDCARY